MYAESPHTIILARDVHAVEAANLSDYCDRLHAAGQRTLTIDLAGVLTCDRPAVAQLAALQAGSAGMRVTMRGAHWSQFLGTLQEAALEETDEVTRQVRMLIGLPYGVAPDTTREPGTRS